MSDLIDRQAVLDSLKEHRALYCDNTPDTFSKLSYAEKSRVDELDTAIATIINLPSVENKGDLISRKFLQTAIHNFFNGLNHTPTEEDIQRYIEVAPSVENKGEWKSEDERVPLEESLLCWCSECNKASFEQTNFCPNCGADMRGGKDEISH